MKTGFPFILLLFFSWPIAGCVQQSRPKKHEQKADLAAARLKSHTGELKKYAAAAKANTSLGILVDMSLPSWKKRLFLVNLKNDSILVAGLCAHGQCGDYTREEVVFSNREGSHCTSQGHYRLGYKYNGDYGWAYKLHGLDTSNNNAFNRYVVFHYYQCVSDFEDGTVCRSDGCPMVSPNVFSACAQYIDKEKKPLLMWIYK